MDKPIVLIDIGNSTIKGALWERDSEHLTVHCWGPGEVGSPDVSSVIERADGAVLSSVVPRVAMSIKEILDRSSIPYTEITTHHCNEWNMLKGLYDGMGGDRIAHCIGLASAGILPAVCVDIGTAITIDRLETGPCFGGGFIVPGPSLMTSVLSAGTALVDYSRIESVPFEPGTDTKNAVKIGCWWASVSQIEGLLNMLRSTGRTWKRLVISGGWAAGFSRVLSIPHELDPHHVFHGMKVIWKAYETGHYPG